MILNSKEADASDSMLTLGVIVVHFGQPELTLRCLSHLRLQEGVRLKVIVVDNSPQGDAPLVKDSGMGLPSISASLGLGSKESTCDTPPSI